MAGYYGYSMSNNAINAYRAGEKPLSKWRKSDILEAIQSAVSDCEVTVKCDVSQLSKVTVSVLKSELLYNSSWHHTSEYYNETEFYSLDTDKLEELTAEAIAEMIANGKKEKIKNKEVPISEKWECSFLEWSGSRNYPKATEYTEIGTVIGKWFYRANGSKKNTTANGFKFIRKVD
jgi:hypothetical protein